MASSSEDMFTVYRKRMPVRAERVLAVSVAVAAIIFRV
jgi:hypothetical protein